ncbi:ABC transporter substrate-binding protein [Novacetimonas hansenii]|uniref:ABC transporter substrate-binding protein n=1 Tax=Novacetimonas hansenii TaxID=436 RepID=A0AAW5EPQ8_NOVHA|nr:ABC transporter substrate-binding protein [Novacetimonas hansenii]MCJ8353806.1 ABC transporter substrate-binding protein [Novacetimonas hansenii]
MSLCARYVFRHLLVLLPAMFALCVTAQAAGQDHHGGELRLLGSTSGGTLDPQLHYTPVYLQIFSAVYDGLLTYRKAGGAAGDEVVPDLATALPQPEDGGRTWTFYLRPGIRFSDGRPVRVQDVQASFQRIFRVGSPTASSFYENIVGAHDCLRQPHACTLSEGMEVDPVTGRITFHLVEPDAEFLTKLAYPHAVILPADTPDHDVGTVPVAGTGAYRVVSYDPQQSLHLARNPYFHVWSDAAQPEGYVDTITYRFGLRDEDEVTSVEAGHDDWMFEVKPLDRLGELGARFPDRVHINPSLHIVYVPLNVHIAPFDNAMARQAVAWALDRHAAAIFYGGPAVATPMCDMAPPNVLPPVGQCPYTLPAVSASGMSGWPRPDLDRARDLVMKSGTQGQAVTIVVQTDSTQRGIGAWMRDRLQQIGYRASVREISRGVQFSYIQNSANNVQISLTSWFGDYPSPSNFVYLLFACSSFHPHSDNSINIPGYCNPALDAVMHRALQEPRDPVRMALWRQASNMLNSDEPAVPLLAIKDVDLVSARLGNYAYHTLYHMLVARAWVR